jgi:hypothetical protein
MKKETCGPIPSLMLIDFNRSIDLKLFDNGTAFVTCVPKKELACVEMLNNRPWIFQVREKNNYLQSYSSFFSSSFSTIYLEWFIPFMFLFFLVI